MHNFLRLLKDGKIQFSERKGYILIFNEGSFFMPVRAFNKFQLELLNLLGVDRCKELFKKIGRYQVEQAIKRYIKISGIDKIPKEKLIGEFVKVLFEGLGIGKLKHIETKGKKNFISFLRTVFSEEYLLEYSTPLDMPWDFYISGMFERGFEMLWGGKYNCKEIKCYAKGDDCCLFEIKRVK